MSTPCLILTEGSGVHLTNKLRVPPHPPPFSPKNGYQGAFRIPSLSMFQRESFGEFLSIDPRTDNHVKCHPHPTAHKEVSLPPPPGPMSGSHASCIPLSFLRQFGIIAFTSPFHPLPHYYAIGSMFLCTHISFEFRFKCDAQCVDLLDLLVTVAWSRCLDLLTSAIRCRESN